MKRSCCKIENQHKNPLSLTSFDSSPRGRAKRQCLAPPLASPKGGGGTRSVTERVSFLGKITILQQTLDFYSSMRDLNTGRLFWIISMLTQ